MNNGEKLLEKIASGKKAHSSIPFWSWNDKLKKEELAAQIADMKSIGMRGFFMHARGGLETEYLSDEWFDAIRFCVEEGKRLGIEAWAYDENGWPSGFAGGELLKDPENHICSIVLETSQSFPEPSDDILGTYVSENGKPVRCTSERKADEYITVRRKRDFSYVDTMNPAVTQKFIEATYARYERELGDEFGKGMPGFFTDEPQYFRYGMPWSDTFRVTFMQKYGYDVLDMLPAIFMDCDGAEEFRYDYFLLCHESFYKGFMKPIYDWCDAHGVQITGHGIEEWGLGGQMMACGGIMPFYLYEHIPGIDYLRRGIKDISGAKQLGSVCEQAGKSVRLTETFAACGWDVSPREIKQIAELQFAGGVNLVCEHLYAYSERGQRKRDYPNHYSEHNPWHKYFGEFENHFSNLGSALSLGNEVANTLVIHPIRSAYLVYNRCAPSQRMADMEKSFSDFVKAISLDHIPFHFGDEGIMEDIAAVEGDKIRVGRCLYDSVILPSCETLTSNTVRLLKEFLANGGKLCIYGTSPVRIDGRISDMSFLEANISYGELCENSVLKIKKDGVNAPLHAQIRDTEDGRLVFVANTSSKTYPNVEITLADCDGLCELDIATLEFRPLRGRKNPDGSLTVLYSFDDSASCLLVEKSAEMLEMISDEEKEYISLNGEFELTEIPENMLTLDNACIALGGGAFSEERPIVRIKDNLFAERYEGRLTLKYNFDVKDVPSKLLLVAEPMKYVDVRINGNSVTPCGEYRIDRRFLAYDIARFVRQGLNEAELVIDYFQRDEVYKVLYGGGSESLRNCLSFDTEIESLYLYGDFAVRTDSEFVAKPKNYYRVGGGFYLCESSKKIDLSDIVRDGYPFFAGELEAKTTVNYSKGSPTCLKLFGSFAVADVSVNGVRLGAKLFGDEFELAEHLCEGENEITVRICVSNRNLLGTHHHVSEEPGWVGPKEFSFEKMWKGAECPEYVREYALKRVGIGF